MSAISWQAEGRNLDRAGLSRRSSNHERQCDGWGRSKKEAALRHAAAVDRRPVSLRRRTLYMAEFDPITHKFTKTADFRPRCHSDHGPERERGRCRFKFATIDRVSIPISNHDDPFAKTIDRWLSWRGHQSRKPRTHSGRWKRRGGSATPV